MIKIALLAPAGAMHRYSGSFGKSLHYAPLTLTTLAALIPDDIESEVRIYDETAEKLLLISTLTYWYNLHHRNCPCYAYADYFRKKES